ncbi:hypothetical protein JST97_22750 [bacterium]|nr:hypothetical protein [bacterium]
MRWMLLLLLAFSGCSQKPAEPPTPAATSRAAETDKLAAEDLADPQKSAPALAWLAAPKHSLWKGDPVAIKLHFEELERAGLKEIYAVGIEEVEGNQVCASFAVVLPPAGDPKRKTAITKYNDFWKRTFGPEAKDDLAEVIVTDEGQKYLYYNFDL